MNATAIERDIAHLVRVARHLHSQRARELGAARLHRLMTARSRASAAVLDAQCQRGGYRAHGRPELRPERIAVEADTWRRCDRRHLARRGFEIHIRSNRSK